MKIMIDVTGCSSERLTGVGNYIKFLFKEMRELDCELVPVMRLKCRKGLKQASQNLQADVRIMNPLRDHFDRSVDVFFGPDCKLIYFGASPRVVTLHDLQPFRSGFVGAKTAPKMCSQLDRLLRRNVSRVIVPSQLVAREFQETYSGLSYRVRCIYHGVDHVPELPIRNRTTSTAFLFLGTLESRKNVLHVIEAFDQVAAVRPEFILNLVGRPGNDFVKIEARVLSSRFRDRIRVISNVSDRELPSYWESSRLFLFPSWYEGFGLPPFEAIRSGVIPIVASGLPIGEIVTRDLPQASPSKAQDFCKTILETLDATATDAQYQQAMRSHRVQIRQLTWRKCAEETLQVFREART